MQLTAYKFWWVRPDEPEYLNNRWLIWIKFSIPAQTANAFIVPQELQSALSLVYSNIPPIKKGEIISKLLFFKSKLTTHYFSIGTDSRVGFGFRLGDHADFQVLLELGPQKETRPLGEPNKDDQSFNKRQVSASELREQLRQQELMTSTERNAASWLETWSKGMKPQEKIKAKPRIKQTAKVALPERAAMPADAVQQLQMLYKMANEATESSSTTSSSSSTTTTEEPESLNLRAPSGFKLPPPALTQDTNSLGISRAKKSSAEITKELMNVSLEA